MSLLLRNAVLGETPTDLFIDRGVFQRIGPDLDISADKTIDAAGKAIVPPLVNGHTHAAMTLLRGYADDMELHTWLTEHIWPLEARLSEEDVYVGSLLACLEMIKSGTLFFNDMYWHFEGTARAVTEMGLRAALSSVFIDFGDARTAEDKQRRCLDLLATYKEADPRLQCALGPHAVYTVSRKSLEWIRDIAEEHDLLIHMHVAETRKEVEDCMAEHGKRPVAYLDELGLLSPRLVACHAVWLTPEEIELLAKRGVNIVHNPVSNMKLCSGTSPVESMRQHGLRIGLGTDGCSSNNALDMFSEMKSAALAAKVATGSPKALPADAVWEMATAQGAAIFNLNHGITEGAWADCLLVDLDQPAMVPCYNLTSNLVYAASGGCVDTAICNGQILMQNRHIAREEEIIARARACAQRLVAG